MEVLSTVPRRLTANHFCFAVFSILLIAAFRAPLVALMALSLTDDKYSHVLLIPIISATLVYFQRRAAFANVQYCLLKSLPFLIAGIGAFWLTQEGLTWLGPQDRLSGVVLSMVLFWMAGFSFCYGARSFRAALFPLLFLLLMIPIPTIVLDSIVLGLQKGSAVMTYGLFKLLGVPVLWRHFRFLLPGVEIEIAQECSGIRSSLALFITSMLAGHLFLQSAWRRTIFSLLTVPVVIFKNAVRIVTISSLGVYVDPGFLHGRLHRYGGLPFSLVSLAILVPFLLVLQRGERNREESHRTAELLSHGVQRRVPAF
jgi:exosortase